MSQRLRVALSAEPFGFGPVSKVCSVAERLAATIDVELIAYGDGLVAEFFEHDGYDVQPLDRIASGYDGAIVAISPSLARTWLQNGTPVFYLDSLAFMWNASYYESELPKDSLTLYFCQDIFGSFENARRNASWLPVVPVQAIVRASAEAIPGGRGGNPTIFNLGGCKNPFSDDATIEYANLVRPIIANYASAHAKPSVLCSRSAAPILGVDVESLAHKSAVASFTASSCVYTSPGLTSLLEFSALGVRPIVLPPQNLSQFYILHHLCQLLPQSRHLRQLTDLYPAKTFANEAEGVAYVVAQNRELCETGDHLPLYMSAQHDPEQHRISLPICDGFDGATQCAREIAKWLSTA
jgi:hypothetical protein